ncbi:DUF721 domain-containing protein [Aquimarina sp. BL5]|uniref:DUF721 domain-containing protein n=1 Tax=Aquimarina sp. BL5 TaxID=1714860 RepID=UPI000E51B6BF|nr:DUF721 domain-containing protein [Aquimarina sp. BL5]AXT53488.1 DUF721 domain-containing protein [Aquimarina sp. BL5]RKN08030.1 DUF721 domain-containing protein [Aquimarina sp. BL5]
MARRQNDLQSINNVLKDFVSENKLQKGLDKVEVRDVWEQIMGPAINKYTRNIKLDRETLYIELTSSVLREELSYGKEKIITNLNESLGRELIKKLVLR